MKEKLRSIRNPVMQKLKLLALSCLLAGPAFGQMFDPSLMEGPRVSPLPLYYDNKGDFHKNLFGLADSGLHLQFLDAFVPAATQPLWIKREYRSGYDIRGVFGIGWVSTLDVHLEPSADKKDLRIFEASGKRTDYEAEDGSENYTAVVGTFLPSKVTRGADEGFLREWDNGFSETFDSRGRRTSIAAGKDKITFSYQGDSPGAVAVSDAVGRKFELTYSGGLLTAIKDPIGRKTTYRYSDGRLVETADSLGRKDLFRYDNGKVSSLTLPRGQKMLFTYGANKTLSEISGPGKFKTSFVWRSDSESPAQELVISYANGTTENIRIEVGSVEGKGFKPANKEALTPADRLGFEIKSNKSGLEVSSLVTNRQIYLRSGGYLFGLDGKGGLTRADQKEPGKLGAALRKGLSMTGPVWRTRVTPAFVSPENDRIRYDAMGRSAEFRIDGNQNENWIWDGADRVTEWVDSDGIKTRYEYDAHNNLVSVKENDKSALTFEYNDADLLVTVKDADGWNKYEYDDFGNCVALKDNTGANVQLEYDAANRVHKHISGRTTTTMEYDAAGRTSKVLVSGKQVVSYTYNEDGLVATETDARGLTSNYTYDDGGRLTSARHSDGSEEKIAYGDRGYSIVTTSGAGTKATREYDNEGRLVRLLPPDGLEFRCQYDERGLPTKFEDSSGTALKCEYDAQGRMTSEQSSDGRSRKWQYDEVGRPQTIQDENAKASFSYSPDGAGSALVTEGDVSTRIEYDASGRPIKRVDSAGEVTEYEYDKRGLLKSIKSPSESLYYEYDGDARRTRITRVAGSTTSFRNFKYDGKGRLIEVRFEDGTTRSFSYDDSGRISSTTDVVGNVYSYRYNTNGDVEVVKGPYGERSFKYDDKGRLVENADSEEGTQRFAYFDATDEAELVDQLGKRTKVKVDAGGRPLFTVDALGGKIGRNYDLAGNLTSYTDPNGNQFTYKYDTAGNLIETHSPEGKVAVCRYDRDQNRRETTVQGGSQLKFEYGPGARLKSVQSGGTTLWSYDYDKKGFLADVKGDTGQCVYERDKSGELIGYKDFFGKRVGFSYDAPGRLETTQLPEGEEFHYRYNERGLIGAIETKTGKVAFSYDERARLSQIDYPAGLKVLYNYGTGQRPKSITCQNAKGDVLSREEYVYDERGDLKSITNLDGRSEYQYDDIGRLISAQYPGGRPEHFQYDRCGNVSKTDDVPTWAYDKDQELTQWGERKLQYDAAGGLTHIADDVEFKWNGLGQLTEVLDKKSGKVNYRYDSEGRRIEKKTTGGVTHYVYGAGNQLLAEYDATGKVIASYVPGADSSSWVAVRKNGQEYYAVRSYNGSLIAVVDNHGAIVKKFRYDAYGQVRDSTGQLEIGPEYAGQFIDSETKLLLFGARYYSPQLKRFLSPDPRGPDRDGSLYGYALSNPLRFTDRAGASSFPAWPNTNGVPPPHIGFKTAPVPPGAIPLPNSRDAIVSKLREIAATEGHLPSGKEAQQLVDRLDSGYIKLEVYDKSPFGPGTAGSQPSGTNTIRIYQDGVANTTLPGQSPIRTAAGTAVHEGEHVFQNLSKDNPYRGPIHEAAAFERGGTIDPAQRILNAQGQPSAARVEELGQAYSKPFKGYTDPSNPPVSDAVKNDPRIKFPDPDNPGATKVFGEGENPRVNAVREVKPTFGNESLTRKFDSKGDELSNPIDRVEKLKQVRQQLGEELGSSEPTILSGKSIVGNAERLKALREQQALKDAARSEMSSAAPKNAAAGEIGEAVQRGESRAVKAIGQAERLAEKGASTGSKAARLAKGAAGVLGKGLKFLPVVGAGVELLNAKDEMDIAKAWLHAVPVIGEIAMEAEMAYDFGKALGEGAADTYLRAKALYDHYKKVYDDLKKAMADWDDALKQMDQADQAKRKKRRNAANSQLPVGDGGYEQLHGPGDTGSSGSNSANANNAGSGAPSSGGNAGSGSQGGPANTEQAGATGATSGSAGNNPSQGGPANTGQSGATGATSGNAASNASQGGPANTGQAGTTGATSGSAGNIPSQGGPSNTGQAGTSGATSGSAGNIPSQGGPSNAGQAGATGAASGQSQPVTGGSSPKIASNRPASGGTSGGHGRGSMSADNPSEPAPDQPSSPPGPDQPSSPSNDVPAFKPIEPDLTKLIPPEPLPVPPGTMKSGGPSSDSGSGPEKPPPSGGGGSFTKAIDNINKKIAEGGSSGATEPTPDDGLPPPPLPVPKPPPKEPPSAPPVAGPDTPPPSQPPSAQPAPPQPESKPPPPEKPARPPSGYNPGPITPKNQPPPKKDKGFFERAGDYIYKKIFGDK